MNAILDLVFITFEPFLKILNFDGLKIFTERYQWYIMLYLESISW